MKKFFFVFILLISFVVLSKSAFSQRLYFCESVDDRGNPNGASSTFYIPSGGGYFYFLVKLGYEVGCTYVYYDIYEVNSDYSETFSTTITQDDMSRDWTWFWKKVTFYNSGYYRVYAYDCNGGLLANAYLTIKYK